MTVSASENGQETLRGNVTIMKVHGLSMTNASAKPQEYSGKGERKERERKDKGKIPVSQPCWKGVYEMKTLVQKEA